MSSFNFDSNAFNTYTNYGNGYGYDESQPLLVSSDTVSGMDAMHYAHPQNSTGNIPFYTSNPPFSPPYAPPAVMNTMPNPQPNFTPQPFLYNHNVANPVLVPNVAAYHQSTAPAASFVQPVAPTAFNTAPTSLPIPVSTSSTSQRAKFPCLSCGKMYTSRPKADTCFLNHIGSKPFICHGFCGVQGW
jgi:hypothetical protein